MKKRRQPPHPLAAFLQQQPRSKQRKQRSPSPFFDMSQNRQKRKPLLEQIQQTKPLFGPAPPRVTKKKGRSTPPLIPLPSLFSQRERKRPTNYQRDTFNFAQAWKAFRLSPIGDTDRDGVINLLDCHPYNPLMQEFYSEKQRRWFFANIDDLHSVYDSKIKEMKKEKEYDKWRSHARELCAAEGQPFLTKAAMKKLDKTERLQEELRQKEAIVAARSFIRKPYHSRLENPFTEWMNRQQNRVVSSLKYGTKKEKDRLLKFGLESVPVIHRNDPVAVKEAKWKERERIREEAIKGNINPLDIDQPTALFTPDQFESTVLTYQKKQKGASGKNLSRFAKDKTAQVFGYSWKKGNFIRYYNTAKKGAEDPDDPRNKMYKHQWEWIQKNVDSDPYLHPDGLEKGYTKAGHQRKNYPHLTSKYVTIVHAKDEEGKPYNFIAHSQEGTTKKYHYSDASKLGAVRDAHRFIKAVNTGKYTVFDNEGKPVHFKDIDPSNIEVRQVHGKDVIKDILDEADYPHYPGRGLPERNKQKEALDKIKQTSKYVSKEEIQDIVQEYVDIHGQKPKWLKDIEKEII